MSTRRVKTIEYDEEDFGTYDDDEDFDYNPADDLDPDNPDNELTSDDRVQMRETVASVREQLDPAINSQVKTVDIWEKAWDSYYDARKVANAMKSKWRQGGISNGG